MNSDFLTISDVIERVNKLKAATPNLDWPAFLGCRKFMVARGIDCADARLIAAAGATFAKGRTRSAEKEYCPTPKIKYLLGKNRTNKPTPRTG